MGAASGCAQEKTFPDQIPDIVATLGTFHSSLSNLDRARFDSVCTDRELYDELRSVLGGDSLAVLSRRIHNPVDSANVVMTVARKIRLTGLATERYELELFMRKEEGRFLIVAHRLKPSPQ